MPLVSIAAFTNSLVAITKTPTVEMKGGSSRMMAAANAGVSLRLLWSKNMKPSASAPASTAATASGRFVIPQILIRTDTVHAKLNDDCTKARRFSAPASTLESAGFSVGRAPTREVEDSAGAERTLGRAQPCHH